MPTLFNLSVFVCLIWITIVSSGPLTVGNFLIITRLPTLSQIREVTSTGTDVQSWDLTLCPLAMGNDIVPQISLTEDNRVSFACVTAAAPNGFNLVVYLLDSTGTLKVNSYSDQYLSVYGSAIVGTDVWINGQTLSTSVNTWIKTTIDGTSAPTRVSLNPANVAMGPRLFYSNSGFSFIQARAVSVVDAPSDPFPALTVICPSSVVGSNQVTAWLPYSDTEIYFAIWDSLFSQSSLVKATKGPTGTWSKYDITPNPQTWIFGLTAGDFNGTRKVFVSYSNQVWSCVDTLSSFTSPVKEFAPNDYTYFFQDIVYIHPLPTCSDNRKNQNETDIDCGGGSCTTCANDKKCLDRTDCYSDYCNPNLTCSTPSCSDGFLNQDETDVDCGGNTCTTKCSDSKACKVNSDCSSDYCNPENKCATPTCSDGYKNQNETDTDCGGTCTSCQNGASCIGDLDCVSITCSNYVCVDLPPVAQPVVVAPIHGPVSDLSPQIAAPSVSTPSESAPSDQSPQTTVPSDQSPQTSVPVDSTPSSSTTPTQSPRGVIKVSSATTQVIQIVMMTVLTLLTL